MAVVFPELREQHGADGHIDADAKRIRSADEFETSALRELFDEDAVAWQQACVVNADAVAKPAFEVLAVGTVEFHANEFVGEEGFFVLGEEVETHPALRGFGGGALREIDEVNGRAFVEHEVGDAFGERRFGVFKFQWHGPRVAAHGDAFDAGEAEQVFFKKSVAPSVPDMRRKRACGIVRSGTCQA